MPQLQPADFRVILAEGLGREAQSTAHAMAYFRDALYVGTSAGNVSGEEAARILRYDPETAEWATVFESPQVRPNKRSHVPDLNLIKHVKDLDLKAFRSSSESVPREVGFRSMLVFKGKSDKEPALYATTMSLRGGLILRSTNGKTWKPICKPGFGNPDIYSFRGLTSFGKRLFTSPTGTVTNEYVDRNLAPEATVYTTDDPGGGSWKEACEPGFGDPANLSIYMLKEAHGYLYAGTANPERGFQLWRTDAKGRPPFIWDCVLTDGADAFNHNLACTAMAEFKGDLYVGSGITGFGYDTVHDIGPASAELLRVHPDKTWDLIAGRPRFTRDGLKVPLSLLGPGLGDFYNSVVWMLCAHEDTLYLGTHQWEAFRAMEVSPDRIVGGYQLWASEDGETWIPVLEDGHGNPAQLGIRTLTSTPVGLFVGTSNHSRLLRILGLRKRPDLQLPSGFDVLLGRPS